MSYTINDEVYKRISKKVEDGIFKKGKKLKQHSFREESITDFPISERTPENPRTREFFIFEFTDPEVFNYIKNHIEQFDREFFKDLLASDRYATIFRNNCFAIMPLE